MAKNLLFWRQIAQYFGDRYFFKNRASSLFFVLSKASLMQKKKSYDYLLRKTFVTDERTSEGMETLDKRSVQLIPANGKQSDNKGQTSSVTVKTR